jgi:hypothetical protein
VTKISGLERKWRIYFPDYQGRSLDQARLENKWKETTWENLGLCGTIKGDSEKYVVRFKWVQTGSEKVPIAEPCSFGTKERKMSYEMNI